MKARKPFIVLLLFGVMIGVFAAYRLWGSMDNILKVAIESYGSNIVGADVRLGSVCTDLAAGRVALNRLSIGNPEGFGAGYAMRFDQVVIELDRNAVAADALVVREIRVRRPRINYKMTLTGNNVERLAENADSYSGSRNRAGPGSGDGSVRFVIENLYINEGEIALSHRILKDRRMALVMPDIHLRGIGREEKGATPAQLGEVVMDSIRAEVGIALASRSIGGLRSGVKKVREGAAGVMDRARRTGHRLRAWFDGE